MSDDRVSWALSKAELPVYRAYLRSAGLDPDRYLSGRRVRCPPAHYGQLAIVFAMANANEIMGKIEGEDARRVVLEHTDAIMSKFQRKAVEQGLGDAVLAAGERATLSPAEKEQLNREYQHNPEDLDARTLLAKRGFLPDADDDAGGDTA
jgi:hypothetical protein